MITATRFQTCGSCHRKLGQTALLRPCSVRARQHARRSAVNVQASDNPARQMLSGLVSTIYKVSATMQTADAGASPMWASLQKLDLAGVQNAIRAGADLNERNAAGDTAMLYIARQGHYKFPPKEIPAALITAGANLEAKDSKGMTALQVALLSGWQNIAEILIKGGASTAGVAEVKPRLTCPDCKRLVAQYNL